MPTDTSVLSTTLDWISTHLNIAGWPALIWLAIRASWKSSRYVANLETRAANVEQTMVAIRDNHLHHIQTGIDDLNANLEKQTNEIVNELGKVRSDLLTVVLKRD